MTAPGFTAESVPRLASGVRLKDDRARGQTVLLAPERVLVLDETAVAVLRRLDGARSLGQLADELAAEYDAPADTILADVRAMLADLAEKGFVEA
ncbi:pyrroloquinoline quinone biosynthesis peptide chaperone PqqD [Rhodovibrio sodomensis]|uniref:Pyrroloquinoline quinone biosynthesis peptide chaperone PqqD n=1 Tax=Rhodovibrio sodomensis TaxID=1088 RepID=A0ABS1DF08_9PROT|nr:pyrroloquinoline quinone biosynthesis peptide chaperone PqqD [Rhodovibrio sodomensis]MBK1669054.1 pyrroloquinoline quinone biosynthesis peptide chaperone PqqD [Rhodovibrio sodomensis]